MVFRRIEIERNAREIYLANISDLRYEYERLLAKFMLWAKHNYTTVPLKKSSSLQNLYSIKSTRTHSLG